jgi:hypothetical protein
MISLTSRREPGGIASVRPRGHRSREARVRCPGSRACRWCIRSSSGPCLPLSQPCRLGTRRQSSGHLAAIRSRTATQGFIAISGG